MPFKEICSDILPNDYELSLVLIGDMLGKKLNKEHKGRNTPTNVLSFPLSDSDGEIFINVRRAERDAVKFGHSVYEHIQYLFIHGCLHLAGYSHGNKMENMEKNMMVKFMRVKNKILKDLRS